MPVGIFFLRNITPIIQEGGSNFSLGIDKFIHDIKLVYALMNNFVVGHEDRHLIVLFRLVLHFGGGNLEIFLHGIVSNEQVFSDIVI